MNNTIKVKTIIEINQTIKWNHKDLIIEMYWILERIGQSVVKNVDKHYW